MRASDKPARSTNCRFGKLISCLCQDTSNKQFCRCGIPFLQDTKPRPQNGYEPILELCHVKKRPSGIPFISWRGWVLKVKLWISEILPVWRSLQLQLYYGTRAYGSSQWLGSWPCPGTTRTTRTVISSGLPPVPAPIGSREPTIWEMVMVLVVPNLEVKNQQNALLGKLARCSTSSVYWRLISFHPWKDWKWWQ